MKEAVREKMTGRFRSGQSRPASFETMRRTARVTGLWYLALAVAGVLGFIVVRSQILVDGDPAATLANLVDREALARLGLVLELSIVIAQALAAVWFFKLFRPINHTAAWAIASFGMANAVAVLISGAALATTLAVAGNPNMAPGGDAAATVQLMYELSASSWSVGAVFFGLWLIPMGHVVATTRLMPVWLGRILIIGGAGYVLSALIGLGVADAQGWLVDGLTYPATIGEFWMIGYLLIEGIRRPEAVAVA